MYHTKSNLFLFNSIKSFFSLFQEPIRRQRKRYEILFFILQIVIYEIVIFLFFYQKHLVKIYEVCFLHAKTRFLVDIRNDRSQIFRCIQDIGQEHLKGNTSLFLVSKNFINKSCPLQKIFIQIKSSFNFLDQTVLINRDLIFIQV